METIDFECNECGHTADFSKEQVMDHIKSHSQFSENNLADKGLLLEGPAYGKECN